MSNPDLSMLQIAQKKVILPRQMSIKEINPDERERRKNRHAETDSRSLTPLITVKSFYDDNDRKKVEEEDIGTAMLPPELSRSSEETLGKSQITK